MELKTALNERLRKAKYIKRWKGKDSKWMYQYRRDVEKKTGVPKEKRLNIQKMGLTNKQLLDYAKKHMKDTPEMKQLTRKWTSVANIPNRDLIDVFWKHYQRAGGSMRQTMKNELAAMAGKKQGLSKQQVKRELTRELKGLDSWMTGSDKLVNAVNAAIKQRANAAKKMSVDRFIEEYIPVEDDDEYEEARDTYSSAKNRAIYVDENFREDIEEGGAEAVLEWEGFLDEVVNVYKSQKEDIDMNLRQALQLRKAKYIKREKGKDGKYKYTYRREGGKRAVAAFAKLSDVDKRNFFKKVFYKENVDKMLKKYGGPDKLWQSLINSDSRATWEKRLKKYVSTKKVSGEKQSGRGGKASTEHGIYERQRQKQMDAFKKGTAVRIVPSGKGEMKQYNIMTVDGSALHPVYFSSEANAKAYADKKGYKVKEK